MFEYELKKSEWNLMERGFDFAYVSYTWRGNNRRIISARRAKQKEIEDYGL
jgi:uncharacterized DUF497 family protein